MADVTDALRKRFVAGLAARWRAITQADSPHDCVQALHRMAGAAGSYGFEAMGKAARRAEQTCSTSSDGWPASGALADLQQCLWQAGLPQATQLGDTSPAATGSTSVS
jgi:HPt (histidine-containing phosphotransfer) domain-containing protein